jgi:hypothetical protein
LIAFDHMRVRLSHLEWAYNITTVKIKRRMKRPREVKTKAVKSRKSDLKLLILMGDNKK